MLTHITAHETKMSDANINIENNSNDLPTNPPPSLPSPTDSSTEKERQREDKKEEDKEQEALRELDNTVNAFRWYYYYVMQRLDRSCSSFSSLPLHHRELVPDFEASIR